MECIPNGLSSVILADDDADDQELFCSALNDVAPKINIETAKSGKELLEMLQAQKTDLLFLDINMFPVNGIEVLQTLQEENRLGKPPIVMFSSSGRPSDLHQSYQLGASLFIRKSETFGALKTLLKAALEMDWRHPESIRARYIGTCFTVG